MKYIKISLIVGALVIGSYCILPSRVQSHLLNVTIFCALDSRDIACVNNITRLKNDLKMGGT